jgi:integrase
VASLVKRAGTARPWQVRFRDHAGRQRAEQFTRKADADARKLEVERAAQTGRIDMLDAGTATLSEVGVEFFRLHKGEWSKNTARGHAYVWNAAVEGESGYPRAALADMPVRAIRKSHVQEYKIDALDAGVPVSSVRRALSLITRTLDHAADEGLIGANPAARVKPPSEAERPRASIVTPEQVEALRAQMAERDAVFVSILAYAGLRPHEARALRVEQFGGADLHLERACGEDGTLQPLKAGHDMRDVPICAALADDVAAVKWPRGLMFPNVHGIPWTKTDYDNWRKRRFKAALVKANEALAQVAEEKGEEPTLLPADLNPYDLRHSICSLWYRQGIDKATIAARLGHSVPVLEKVYAHAFKALDPLGPRSVDDLIAAAR